MFLQLAITRNMPEISTGHLHSSLCKPFYEALARATKGRGGTPIHCASASQNGLELIDLTGRLNMSSKYEFVPGDEIVIAPGRTLRRIRALVAISYFAAPGALGGYVEDVKNLDVSGNAWVYGDAQVYGNAWVYGNARVSGNARVYGEKMIFWASKVGTSNGTLTVYNTVKKELQVTRGCFIGSVDEFLAKSEKEHDDQTHLEYRLLIEVAHSRITRAAKAAS